MGETSQQRWWVKVAWWRRRLGGEVSHVPLPDGDTVPIPGYPRFAELLTRELPLVSLWMNEAPLMTPGQQERGLGRDRNKGGRRWPS